MSSTPSPLGTLLTSPTEASPSSPNEGSSFPQIKTSSSATVSICVSETAEDSTPTPPHTPPNRSTMKHASAPLQHEPQRPNRPPRMPSADTPMLNEKLQHAIGSSFWDFEEYGGLDGQPGGLQPPASIRRRNSSPPFLLHCETGVQDQDTSQMYEFGEEQKQQLCNCQRSESPEVEASRRSLVPRRELSDESFLQGPSSSNGSFPSPALTMASSIDETDTLSPRDERMRSESSSSSSRHLFFRSELKDCPEHIHQFDHGKTQTHHRDLDHHHQH